MYGVSWGVVSKEATQLSVFDGQQFHQYQQNEQTPFISNHWKLNRPQHMALEIQVLSWDRYQQKGRAIPVNGTITLPFWYLDLHRQYRYKKAVRLFTQIHSNTHKINSNIHIEYQNMYFKRTVVFLNNDFKH